jgi:carbonyl reductase 1
MSISRLALVTGGNQGIGYSIVKLLARQHKDLKVLVGSRDISKGKEAVNKLINEEKINEKQLDSIQIDLDDEKSIQTAVETIKKHYPSGLDILINNAGMAFKGSRFDEEVCRQSAKTNYYGTKSVTLNMQPLLNKNARVVIVASMAGRSALRKMSETNRNKFMDPKLTIEQLDGLIEQFCTSVAKNTHIKDGWNEMGYGTSKAATLSLTRILARDNKISGCVFNAVCPGWVSTSMSSYKGTKTPDEGAQTPIYCATLPVDDKTPNGKFFEDSQEASMV